MTRHNEPDVASIWELFDEAGPNPLGGIANQTLHSFRRFAPADFPPPESLLLQTVVTLGDRTTEGQVIEAVSIAWFELVAAFSRDPSLIYELAWRKWEEMMAGAYSAQGWQVTLTPASNDGGRDVIATRHDFGAIRIIEQVKAYKPSRFVDANDVRALIGVIDLERNVSKGICTTTSDFAPGIYKDKHITEMMPTRLELRSGPQLLQWLKSISNERRKKGVLGGT